MANYDDVIEKNKRYLTKAQVNALVAASKEYNIQNAGNRAGALASAREQYDTGYRGLQNMGLAGGVSAAPTSGEVPRLKAEVQTPFDAYNNRLKQVENMRLNALGGQMAESTRRARAAEAARQEALRQAQLSAAAAKAREERRISAGLRQTDMEATGRSGSTINSDTKRQRNVNMTDTASNGEREAEAAARVRAAAEATRIGAGLHQTARETAGLSGSSLNIGQNRQRNVNMTDTASNGEREAESAARSRAAVEAAAATLGIATNKYNDAYTRAQMEANAGKASEVPTFKVQSGSTTASDLKRAQNVGMTDTASNRNNTGSSRRYATQGTTWSSQGGQVEGPSLKEVDDAIAVYESAVKAYEDTAGHGAPSEASREPINKANELLNSLGFASIYSAKRYRDSITNTNEPERSTEEPDYLVKARREMEDAQAKYESALAGTNTLQQQILGILRKRSAGKQVTEQDVQNVMRSAHAAYISGPEDEKKAVIDTVMEAYGFRPYGMDDDAYKRDIQKYRDIKQAMQLLQNKDAAGGEQGAILTLQRYGLTEEQASKWLKEYTEERDRRAEYNYYRPGILAQIEHQGEKPTGPFNEEEKDQRYRDVNGLPLGSNLYTAYFADRLPDNGQYMTDEQRNVYNAIYEREGIEAANQYLDDIQPYINLQRAAQDEEYYKQLAKEHPLAADALSVGQNLFGSMPAMAEKLTIGARNVIMGTEDPRYIDVNSRASRLSNAAGTIRGERTRLIQEGYYRNNATNWLHDKGLISDGMKNGLDAINKKEWVNNTLSFLYQSKMSMADSAVAMAVAWTGAPWMVDALFFSSAGNEAYKDARARGATQEEALGFSILSGTAEALFEHVSIESFMDKFVNNTPQLAQNWLAKMLAQSLTEASEETCTEIATVFADMIAMGDKSEWARAAEAGPEEFNRFLRQKAEDVGMAGLGGFISGLAFGGFGTAMNATKRSKYGKTLLETGQADQYLQQARLLGGDQLNYAADSFEKHKSRSNAAELGIRLEERIKELNETKPGAAAKSMDVPAALTVILEGSRMSAGTGTAVLNSLGAETVESMGYNATSGEALANSYNERIGAEGITSRSDALAQAADKINNSLQELRGTGAMGALRRDVTSAGFQRAGAVAEEYAQRRGEQTYTAARNAAVTSVWANPTQGLAVTQADGTRITPMPGNMTAVERAEQERTNFQARSTATKGRVTYAVAGMEARKGLSNEQTYSEIQNGLTKEARKKAQVYEKLADALGVNMVIHDVMTGTNGFIDEKGNMHVVLSGKQSVLRVAAHELTHWMKEHNDTGYASMREHLVKDVGQERFDRMLKQKAREYGIDMSTEKGRTVADDEVCAELCERMLADTDALERFAEKDTEAAKTLKDRLLKILNAIKRALKDVGNRDFGSSWSDLVHEQETIESWISNLQTAIENADQRASTNEGVIGKVAGTTSSDLNETISDIKEANTVEEMDDAIAEHSVDVIAYDMAGYMDDLKNAKVMSASELKELMRTMNAAIDKVKAHRAILDYGTELTTEEEIQEAKRSRAYMPYKQNADPHYKLALDFSTLCRKRVLLQTIQERLQAKLGRALSQEETVAIRLELQKLQREGYKVEVACALCYVEAARLKSPKVINKFLSNTEAEMRNYFAQKNPASKNIILGMQQKWKVDHGYAPDTTKKQMSSADVAAFNDYSRSIREQFESDHPAEQVTIDRAVKLANGETVQIGGIKFPGRETFLSASWLTKLKSVEPDIFNAFTDKVRSATRSKAQETDTFYSRGDIDMVTEAILKYANAESGFRHQSWSDFVPTHLLDTMAAVIEMSTRKAKMHAYTKVPAMVRLLGKTGMALNMSLIPSGNTGIDANGNLVFDSVEGMPWETMMELRDMFPETAGNIAIGINGEQIQKLLANKDIDYVIPYHASGMNKNMRGYLDIRAWSEYTSSQNEKTNHRGTKGAAPELAEWFDEKAAAKATDGEAFMREASEKYLQLCYERNLTPKFAQYLQNNGDGSYSLKEGYENYWKMLTDRKMVNQKTGKVIIQQAVKPTFDQDTVLGILEDRLNDPAIQDAERAADIVTEQFSGWRADRNNADAEAIQAAKDLRDRTAAITAQKTAEAGGVRNSLDTDYMRLAEKQEDGKLKKTDENQLRKMVDDAAKAAFPNSILIQDGEFVKMWHHSNAEFNEFIPGSSPSSGGIKGIFFTPNEYGAVSSAGRKIHKQYYLNVENLKFAYGVKADAEYVKELRKRQEGVTDPNEIARINREFSDETGIDAFFDWQNGWYTILKPENIKSADLVTYDDDGNIIPLSERFRTDRTGDESWKNKDIRYDLDTDELRKTFTHIDTSALENGLESLKNVTPGKGLWAIKDISRFLDSVAGGSKELRDNLTKIFEAPHRQALKNYATGVGEMQKRVLEIGAKAGVCDSKGHHFDSKKSAAIQNIGEGFSNRHTDVSVRMVDADAVRVTATDKETGKALGTKGYTFRELRGAYGREVADQLWSEAFDAAQEAGKPVDVEREVNTQPYTLDDLKAAYPQDWQKLKTAADEFRTMYDEYIRDINTMLETIYPNASKYATVDKITEAIEKKQQRLADRKAAYNVQIENLQKSLEEKEQQIASKKKTDTKAFRELVDQANQIKSKIADAQAEIAEYEANVKDELTVMGEEKALMQNAEREGDSLGRMHRLEYRSDYFHHFTEMTSGVQNLKSIFTGNTDISPAVVGKSDQTKPKSRFAGFFQKRQGGDYTADALNGMLRYGQLAEYKLAFDPFAAYLRDVEKQVTNLDKNATNRDNLIRYIQQWTNTILGKSHTIDRALVDSGIGMRSKMFKALSWINSRVIQNTLLWNMRSALIQISNVTNAKGIVTNNLDWANGLRKWALAARGNSEMQSIMNQSTFLASRYMDNLQLTDSVFKNAKQFAGWMLGALDEVSAKATWWAAYTQYQRNPNAKVIQNAYRTYDNAIDYADDVTRRTHAGRGVGELAPAMTSRVINLVAPFQVEVNNTYQLLKDNVKQKNYLGLLSTGLSVFALNTIFEAIVGSTPLGFDIIRAIVDIAFGIAGDDPDDDKDDYDVKRAAQRLAGEFVGGLPYANQIVGLIGKDNAEKVIGSDTDVTRYGNTQIGLNAIMNTVAGASDIGSAVKEGKNLFTETNFISDIDDLLNIIMPMGAKQLTRTAEGLMTVAKGYGSKADKEGNEKVQFVADNDLVNWLHAGLFGKWSLTQASEYFDEERLLPKLFGAYEGPKSATGQMIDAKEYKAALETGIDGKQFFTLKDDMKGYSTQGGKRAELMQQDFSPEQKAKLDALMVPSKDAEMKVEGAVVYQKSGEDWKVKADYSNQDMFDLSQAGDKAYTGTLEAMEKTGLPQDQAVLAASMWDQAKQADDSKAEFRNLLRDNKNLTVAQKEALDLQYCGNKYPADYSDPDLYELSLDSNRSTYEKAKQAKKQGVPVKTFTALSDKKKAHEGEGQTAYMRDEIMKTNLSAKQKELLDDLLVSDSGRNPDYSSQAWYDVSMLGKSQYETAKEGAKVGLKPEVYLKAYKKYKEIQAKDENGKYVNTKAEAKKLMKQYLDGLTITAPVYDYIWYNVFKQKKK